MTPQQSTSTCAACGRTPLWSAGRLVCATPSCPEWGKPPADTGPEPFRPKVDNNQEAT
jgi:hypothetical protein